MKKQTAVEWLKKELEEYGSSSHLSLDWETFDELVEQAKAIEREQIEQAFNEEKIKWATRILDGRMSLSNEIAYENGEAYYNETYKGGKK